MRRTIDRLRLIQIDSVNVLVRAHYMPFFSRLGPYRREMLDELAYRFHAFAFPLWTFTIAAGAVWAEYAWGRFWGWDPKETWSLVTWVIYAGFFGWTALAAVVIWDRYRRVQVTK